MKFCNCRIGPLSAAAGTRLSRLGAMYATPHAGGYHGEKGHGETAPFNGYVNDDFSHGTTVETCELQVRHGFLRKVFGIVATQLAITAAMCAVAMYESHVRAFVLGSPSLLFVSFIASFGTRPPHTLICGMHPHR